MKRKRVQRSQCQQAKNSSDMLEKKGDLRMLVDNNVLAGQPKTPSTKKCRECTMPTTTNENKIVSDKGKSTLKSTKEVSSPSSKIPNTQTIPPHSRKKRKTTTTSTTTTTTTTTIITPTTKKTPPKSHPQKQPLKNLTIAISTLDTGTKHTTTTQSYKSLSALCIAAGAIVTTQVHKRIFAVICSASAVRNATQRIRKAMKRRIRLVDVTWVKVCVERGERVDVTPFLLDGLVTMGEDKFVKEERGLEETIGTAVRTTDAGWSEPVSLDCCCVCHENGDLNCEWCVSCNVTLALKKRQEMMMTTTDVTG